MTTTGTDSLTPGHKAAQTAGLSGVGMFRPIPAVDEAIRAAAFKRLDSLTKPPGSLGLLEPLAAQLCAIQRTLSIKITNPVSIVFAADHGVADRGVSAFPKQVTIQMVANFLRGGAGISVLAKLHGIDLWIVDAGVDGDCGSDSKLIDAKIRAGTRDFVDGPAMTAEECRAALAHGQAIFDRVAVAPCNTVILGEMGIGNTASSAMLMHGLSGNPLADCIGRGTGLDDVGLQRKQSVLTQALSRIGTPKDPLQLLAEFGGYEIAMLTGAALAAAARGTIILVDGFTVSVAIALSAQIDPNILGYCVFAHRSAEKAHRALLDYLGVTPLLDLQMRLGEGSGAALALPQLRATVALFTEMATFETAGVSNRDA